MRKTKHKPKPQPKPWRAKILKSSGENIEARFNDATSMVCFTMETHLMSELKSLAVKRKTTVAQEITDALEAHVLGVSPADARLMNAIIDRFRATMDRNTRNLDELLYRIQRYRARQGKTRGRSSA